MKFFLGAICAMLLAVFASTDAQAQYCVTNNSTVVIPAGQIIIQTTCGTFTVPTLPPGATWCVPLPTGCVVKRIIYRGVVYPVGYNGPLPPPNPPFWLVVAATGAIFS